MREIKVPSIVRPHQNGPYLLLSIFNPFYNNNKGGFTSSTLEVMINFKWQKHILGGGWNVNLTLFDGVRFVSGMVMYRDEYFV